MPATVAVDTRLDTSQTPDPNSAKMVGFSALTERRQLTIMILGCIGVACTKQSRTSTILALFLSSLITVRYQPTATKATTRRPLSLLLSLFVTRIQTTINPKNNFQSRSKHVCHL